MTAVMQRPEPAVDGALLPTGPWVMQQRWHELLFAHWPVNAEAIRRLIPAELELETHGGQAWVGVIPFRMSGVRFRGVPPLPTTHAFAELNVRTYVRHGGRPGVWFFSLDAASTLAVIGARLGARLPYYRATIAVDGGSSWIRFRSERWEAGGGPAAFAAAYRPKPRVVAAPPGSLESFLTDRYCLFSSDRNRLWRVDIAHSKWTLYDAEAFFERNTMLNAAGLPQQAGAPVLHFAAYQDVRFWWPERVG